MAFDGNWTITLTASNADLSMDPDGVIVGNGKVCMFPAYSNIDMQRTLLTTKSQVSPDTAYANTVDGFTSHRLLFYNASNDILPLSLVSQQINMYTGVFTSTFASTDPDCAMTVTYDLYACRQYPLSTIQTIKVTPDSNVSFLGWQHETYASPALGETNFQTSSIYNEAAASQGAVYFVEGSAPVTLTGDTIAVSSTYVYTDLTNLGFNTYRSDPKRCYNRFALSNAAAGNTYTLNVLSTQMTTCDYANPLQECRRVCLNMMLRCATPISSVAQIRSDHVTSWASLWAGRLAIDPKLGVTADESAAITQLNRTLLFAFYNIYSSTRENALPACPLPGAPNLNAIDLYGNIALDCDLWLVPVLTLFRPEAARSLLEFRYMELAAAIRLASTYGFKGAQFPYVNDSTGSVDALYWDNLSPLHVFNSALVGISAWNLYRVQQDDEWLRSVGYPILKNISDFFASKVDVDEDGTVHLRQVCGLNTSNQPSDDESMTNYLVRLAVKYTIEASYALTAYVKPSWLQMYYGLPVTLFPGTQVIALDATADTSQTADILETLIPLVPLYNFIFYRVDLNSQAVAPAANLAYWQAHMTAGDDVIPTNQLLLAMLSAQCAQLTTDPVARDSYLTTFQTLVDSVTAGATANWGNFKRFGSERTYNDVTLSALFILVFVLGCASVSLLGGVAESRFYYEAFRVNIPANSVLPKTWKNINIMGAGANGTCVNTLTYP